AEQRRKVEDEAVSIGHGEGDYRTLATLANQLTEIVDQSSSSKGINGDELVSLAKIALCCTQENPENRPMITDVAKQLRQLNKD
ncbi:hypothetical protein Goklo_027852, partial [Gossypium klotzschianum]|nr:hypothetical protein [Gossypium klotzschianum]